MSDTERPAWRPIETAPKDGEPLDLWSYWPEHKEGRRSTDVRWDAVHEEWNFGQWRERHFVYRPVHLFWMRVAPPKDPTP